MKTLLHKLPLLALALVLPFASCGDKKADNADRKKKTRPLSTDPSIFPLTAGKYEILGILTDQKDPARAQQLPEDTINKYGDIKAMVGLWAYNPPAILNAVKAANKLGQIKIVGFDEHADTLDGIAAGHIHATVVQDPYMFGFRSIEFLAAIARGQNVDVPENKLMEVPYQIIKKDTVSEFRASVQKRLAGDGDTPEPLAKYDSTKPVRIAYVTNGVDPFWDLANEGLKKANPIFNVEGTTIMPPSGTVDEQMRMINERMTSGIDGIAISPIDPANQGSFINEIAAKLPLITQDSDAPDTNRLFYLGTSNYNAGRAVGRMIKEVLPEGGKVMIFVGKMEVLNAQERSQGVIDELLEP
jgi:ribose transport system substrate-binding protein